MYQKRTGVGDIYQRAVSEIAKARYTFFQKKKTNYRVNKGSVVIILSF